MIAYCGWMIASTPLHHIIDLNAIKSNLQITVMETRDMTAMADDARGLGRGCILGYILGYMPAYICVQGCLKIHIQTHPRNMLMSLNADCFMQKESRMVHDPVSKRYIGDLDDELDNTLLN